MRRALATRSAQVLERCGSTNDVAAAWARDGASHLSIVVADAQDAGRGRHARTWLSEPGAALLASIVVRPELPVARWGLLPLLTAVACASAIERRTQVQVGVKWPNDLVVDGAKLGGILCEADPGAWAVLGIGINVSGAPHVDRAVASLAELGALRLDRADLAAALLEDVDAALRDPDDGLRRYRELSATLGHPVRITGVDGGIVEGTADAIADDGALRLLRADGTVASVHAGDVEHVRPAG